MLASEFQGLRYEHYDICSVLHFNLFTFYPSTLLKINMSLSNLPALFPSDNFDDKFHFNFKTDANTDWLKLINSLPDFELFSQITESKERSIYTTQLQVRHCSCFVLTFIRNPKYQNKIINQKTKDQAKRILRFAKYLETHLRKWKLTILN